MNEELAKNNCRTIENTLDYFNNNILDSDNAIYKLVDTLLERILILNRRGIVLGKFQSHSSLIIIVTVGWLAHISFKTTRA